MKRKINYRKNDAYRKIYEFIYIYIIYMNQNR